MSRDPLTNRMVILGRQENWELDSQYQELRDALEKGQIVAYYQPIVDAKTLRIVAVEALARWLHPLYGVVAPSNFIPFAETCGLIHQLGHVILHQACEQGQNWREQGYNIDVYVNVSCSQLDNPQFSDMVQAVLDQTGLPAHFLHLEMTESMPISHSPAKCTRLNTLKYLGHPCPKDQITHRLTLENSPARGLSSSHWYEKVDVGQAIASVDKESWLGEVQEARFEASASSTPVDKLKVTQAGQSGFGLSTKAMLQRLRDYEWLEQCTFLLPDSGGVFDIMEAVRNVLQERLSFDRFGILLSDIDDRYCLIHEIVTRDDLTPIPAGSLMAIKGTGVEHLYKTKQLHYNPDIATRPEFSEDNDLSAVGVRSLVRIPLIVRGRVFGVLNMKSVTTAKYAPRDMELMRRAANRLAPQIYNLKLIDSLEHAAYKDGLTGALNRRFLTEASLNPEAEIVSKFTAFRVSATTPIYVIFIDVDGLKYVNDTFGHAAGDEKLRAVCLRVTDVVNGRGIVVRYGGDEFLVILPDVSEETVKRMAPLFNLFPDNATCGCSIGVSHGVWTDLPALVDAADLAMYRHKVESNSTDWHNPTDKRKQHRISL